MFDANTYFENLTNSLKLTKGKYISCEVSGIDNLEGVLEKSKRNKYFVAVDDTASGQTVFKDGAYWDRRPVTVFILAKFDYPNMVKRRPKLEETKLIHKKFLSKMIKDRLDFESNLTYLRVNEKMPYHEIPGFFAMGCTGIYFTFAVDNPLDLRHDANDWE